MHQLAPVLQHDILVRRGIKMKLLTIKSLEQTQITDFYQYTLMSLNGYGKTLDYMLEQIKKSDAENIQTDIVHQLFATHFYAGLENHTYIDQSPILYIEKKAKKMSYGSFKQSGFEELEKIWIKSKLNQDTNFPADDTKGTQTIMSFSLDSDFIQILLEQQELELSRTDQTIYSNMVSSYRAHKLNNQLSKDLDNKKVRLKV